VEFPGCARVVRAGSWALVASTTGRLPPSSLLRPPNRLTYRSLRSLHTVIDQPLMQLRLTSIFFFYMCLYIYTV